MSDRYGHGDDLRVPTRLKIPSIRNCRESIDNIFLNIRLGAITESCHHPPLVKGLENMILQVFKLTSKEFENRGDSLNHLGRCPVAGGIIDQELYLLC